MLKDKTSLTLLPIQKEFSKKLFDVNSNWTVENSVFEEHRELIVSDPIGSASDRSLERISKKNRLSPYDNQRGKYQLHLGRIILNHVIVTHNSLLGQSQENKEKIIQKRCAELITALRAFYKEEQPQTDKKQSSIRSNVFKDDEANQEDDELNEQEEQYWEWIEERIYLSANLLTKYNDKKEEVRIINWLVDMSLVGVKGIKVRASFTDMSSHEKRIKENNPFHESLLRKIREVTQDALDSLNIEDTKIPFSAAWDEIERRQVAYYQERSQLSKPNAYKMLVFFAILLTTLALSFIYFLLQNPTPVRIGMSLIILWAFGTGLKSLRDWPKYNRVLKPEYMKDHQEDLSDHVRLLNQIYDSYKLEPVKFRDCSKESRQLAPSMTIFARLPQKEKSDTLDNFFGETSVKNEKERNELTHAKKVHSKNDNHHHEHHSTGKRTSSQSRHNHGPYQRSKNKKVSKKRELIVASNQPEIIKWRTNKFPEYNPTDKNCLVQPFFGNRSHNLFGYFTPKVINALSGYFNRKVNVLTDLAPHLKKVLKHGKEGVVQPGGKSNKRFLYKDEDGVMREACCKYKYRGERNEGEGNKGEIRIWAYKGDISIDGTKMVVVFNGLRMKG